MTTTTELGQFASIFVTARDGLRLHARDYGARTNQRVPVICLPGLTRTAADFHPLAVALSSHQDRPRRVLALDYRGRGESDYASDPDEYSIAVETSDVIDVAVSCEAMPAVFIGTSRGGLIAMALAAMRPTMIAGVVLNDIGPAIEIDGLLRIKGYVGRGPAPRSFEEAAAILHRRFGSQFSALGPADWAAWAHRSWKLDGDQLIATYDPKLARTLEDVAPDGPVRDLWPQFDALAGVPLMLIRGENSDILSRETVAAMRARRSDLTVVEIPDQGHTPLLEGPDILNRIADFVAGCDRRHA